MLQVAGDCHVLDVPQHIMRLSTVDADIDNWTRGADCRHTTPQSAALSLHPHPVADNTTTYFQYRQG